MAREFARLMTSIWQDDDFIRLTSGPQLTYLALISSPDLSWCGVVPLLPQRLALLSVDVTERKIRNNLAALEGSRFVVTDTTTAELAVRSYVRHDNILRQPNVVKAMVKALNRVHSPRLRGVIEAELGRAHQQNPEAKGWPTIRSEAPELFARIQGTGSSNPSANPFGNPSRKAG